MAPKINSFETPQDVANAFASRLIDLLNPVSYTHLRAHETPEHLVCRLLLEKKTLQQ